MWFCEPFIRSLVVVCLVAGSTIVEAQQPKPISKEKLEKLQVMMRDFEEKSKAMPTRKQSDELSKKLDDFQLTEARLHQEQEAFVSRFEADIAASKEGYLLNAGHVAEAIALSREEVKVYSQRSTLVRRWAEKYGRHDCLKQIDLSQRYVEASKRQWERKIIAMPLGTLEGRLAASSYMFSGDENLIVGFRGGGVGDLYGGGVDRENIRIIKVCMAAAPVSEPGSPWR